MCPLTRTLSLSRRPGSMKFAQTRARARSGWQRKPCNLGHQADTKCRFSGHQTGHQGGKLLRTKRMVPKKGLEPPHPCGYMDLNHARLPIPPLRRVTLRIVTPLAGRCRGRTILYSTDDEGRVKRSPIANTYNRRTERNPLARRIAMTNPQKLPP